MRCINPLKSGLNIIGKRTYKSRQFNPGNGVPMEFECRKCLPCRLNIAREKAVRCVHEAAMHDDNIFLTLTYDDAHLASPRLDYRDFQLFMMRLREKVTRGITDKSLRDSLYIPYMVTGEYGEKNKRPHWHAILFNYSPSDAVYKYSTHSGERVFDSAELSSLWGKGNLEFGSVTIESAGYVARYAAKKLVHGRDGEHDFDPIHKTSAIVTGKQIGRAHV